MYKVLSLILGGGKGTRLYPLTKDRAKPAVPFAGKYRLVDIPISNCLNSGLDQIFILTQFNSASLHRHLAKSYKFDRFTPGFIEILAAEQTFEHSGWYDGTADAVRKAFNHFQDFKADYYLILAGDQLYQMDFQKYLKFHIESGADITVATTPVAKSDINQLGIVKSNDKNKIVDFVEKPEVKNTDFDYWKMKYPRPENSKGEKREFLASMGIYIFNSDVLEECLDNEYGDFGKQVIPEAVTKYSVNAYVHDGYWADIGTIKNFYEASIDLTKTHPRFNFFNEQNPIYTHPRNLPSARIFDAELKNVNLSDGCIIKNCKILNSIVGIRSIINNGVELDGVLCMGADYFENKDQVYDNKLKEIPNLGIGKNTKIRKAIIDKNARIGENCSIGFSQLPYKDGVYGDFYISDGIIIINKNAVIPDGTAF